MPPISKSKQDKITEQIMHYLFSISPESSFTSDIAKEIARDEEFILRIMKDLKSKNLVVEVNKNSIGLDYLKRKRWRISNEAHNAYSKLQKQHNQFSSKII
jgi:predicted transcriptional regulator with HTH domain